MARSDQFAEFFRQPTLVSQRNYEICRAYYLEQTSASELARRFEVSVPSVRAIVRQFNVDPQAQLFFVQRKPGRKTTPKRDQILERARELRRQQLSFREIFEQLHREGHEISESYLFRILQREGLTGQRRRGGRPTLPGQRTKDGSEAPATANVKMLSLSPGQQFKTDAAGLFLFLDDLVKLDFPQAVRRAGLPGSKQIPAPQALLAILATKLLGKRRISHISDLSCDLGAGLFAGLNVLPKATYATDYSYQTSRAMGERLVAELIAKLEPQEDEQFNLDFHSIPHRGVDSDLQGHWVAKRNRGLPSIMALVVQEDRRRTICYATANIVADEADQMVWRFADYWKEQTGHHPARLLFDSRATTYPGLNELERREVGFITIRRRGGAMIRRARRLLSSQGQRCQVKQAKGKRRNVRFVDETIRLDGYEKPLRQLIVDGLGHESPTFLLTNDRPQALTARQTLETYASRNHIENSLGEQITFFHLDCLSSDVRLNVDFDLALTVVGDLCYRRLAERLKGFDHTSPARLHRNFVDASGEIVVAADEIIVRPTKRAHNPVLKEAGFDQPSQPIPWLGDRSIRFEFPRTVDT